MRKKKVTFADIAAYTNFSKTTISRYFNDPDSLTIENQEKIAQALKTLGYQENKLAKVLANGKSEFVGIIVPNLYLHYYAEMLNQILATYGEHNYKFLVFVGDNDKEVEQKYVNELLAYNIEGLIILSHTMTSKELAAYQIPIVTIERESEHVCSVCSDNYTGGVQAASLLIENKCDKLIHINASIPEYVPAYGRIKGFEDTCQNKQVPYEVITTDFGPSYDSTVEKLREIFFQIEQMDAEKKGLFLSNDTYANIFLNLVVQKYGTLPSCYRIIGYDNSPIASEAIYPITTIDQQIETLVQNTMELLILQMNEMKKRVPKPLEAPIHRQVAPVLIQRHTTDPAVEMGEK